MSKWIDADALKASYIVTSTTTNSLCHLYVSIEDINDAPSIDIVRCAECKHWHEKDQWCSWKELVEYDDWFCADGEREGE